jgi:1,4-dihydroxy-6-naphthoate synthase
MHCPIPLGAIAVRRDLGAEVARAIDEQIRASLRAAWANPSSCEDFVRRNAHEMSPEVVQRHIDLYVNDYSIEADRKSVETLVALGETRGLYPKSRLPIFAV